MPVFNHVTLDNLDEVAGGIIHAANGRKLWLFRGEMGAGKTTLIKTLCRQMGAGNDVSSPTFSLVNEYKGSDGILYHFDFYRINDIVEVYDIGYEDYFYSGHICLIEWPEKMDELLTGENTFDISIKTENDQTRTIITN